jgi:glycosyltransferase involved in cell wall biosynthesis
MPSPALSIITPVLNGARYIAQTAGSILSGQPGVDLEWVVVDGGSTDATLEILAEVADPRITIIPDTRRGQSAAINLGLSRATAPVLAWLGADDLYDSGALAFAAQQLATPSPGWLVGQCNIIDPAGQTIRQQITGYKNRHLRAAATDPHRAHRTLLAGTNFIAQPAVFFNRAALNALPSPTAPLDESLHYTMDYDLWLRLWQITPPKVVHRPLASFRFHPDSKSGQVSRAQFDEQLAVAARYTTPSQAPLLRAHRRRIELIIAAYKMMRWLKW